MDGFRRELVVTGDEALNLIGRSVTIAKQATPRYVAYCGKIWQKFLNFTDI